MAKKKTVKQILYSWLQWRQEAGDLVVRNSDMDEVKKYGQRVHGQPHNASTYEREFRRARADYPGRFVDVSDQFPDRAGKSWKLKKKGE